MTIKSFNRRFVLHSCQPLLLLKINFNKHSGTICQLKKLKINFNKTSGTICQLKMIFNSFCFILYEWMLEQLMYAISLKAQAKCPQCKEAQQLDQSHGCYFVSSSYHERWQLLCHFNASVHTVWQILKTPTMLDNVKEYINTRLLQAGFLQTTSPT